MGIQEDILRIKSLISESVEDDPEANKFIEEYERNLNEVEPMIPEIVDFLKENLKDSKLIDVEGKMKSVHFGSTYWFNEEGKKIFGYSTNRFVITVSVINANVGYKQDIKKTAYNILKNYFNIDTYLYGSVIDLDFINYTPEKF